MGAADAPEVRGRTGQAWRRQLSAYGWLASTCRSSNFVGLLVSASLVPWGLWDEGRTWALAALAVVLCGATLSVASTLDQLQGRKDGSDSLNYATSDAAGWRSLAAKPLVTELVTPAAARRFAMASAVVAVAALVGAVVVARPPAWVLPSLVVVALLCVQYSAGLRLSYIGGQELLLIVGYGASVLYPVTLVTGRWTGAAFVSGFLVGLWHLQVSAFSNQWDVHGDRQADRLTLAVRVDGGAYRRFLWAAFGVGWAALAVGVAGEWLAAWTLPALLPWAALQARQVRWGLLEGSPLRARHYGFRAVWAGSAGLCVGNVLAQVTT